MVVHNCRLAPTPDIICYLFTLTVFKWHPNSIKTFGPQSPLWINCGQYFIMYDVQPHNWTMSAMSHAIRLDLSNKLTLPAIVFQKTASLFPFPILLKLSMQLHVHDYNKNLLMPFRSPLNQLCGANHLCIESQFKQMANPCRLMSALFSGWVLICQYPEVTIFDYGVWEVLIVNENDDKERGKESGRALNWIPLDYPYLVGVAAFCVVAPV